MKLGNGSLPRSGLFRITTPPSASRPTTVPNKTLTLHCTKTAQGRRRVVSSCGRSPAPPAIAWVHVTLSLADCRHHQVVTLLSPFTDKCGAFACSGSYGPPQGFQAEVPMSRQACGKINSSTGGCRRAGAPDPSRTEHAENTLKDHPHSSAHSPPKVGGGNTCPERRWEISGFQISSGKDLGRQHFASTPGSHCRRHHCQWDLSNKSLWGNDMSLRGHTSDCVARKNCRRRCENSLASMGPVEHLGGNNGVLESD